MGLIVLVVVAIMLVITKMICQIRSRNIQIEILKMEMEYYIEIIVKLQHEKDEEGIKITKEEGDQEESIFNNE